MPYKPSAACIVAPDAFKGTLPASPVATARHCLQARRATCRPVRPTADGMRTAVSLHRAPLDTSFKHPRPRCPAKGARSSGQHRATVIENGRGQQLLLIADGERTPGRLEPLSALAPAGGAAAVDGEAAVVSCRRGARSTAVPGDAPPSGRPAGSAAPNSSLSATSASVRAPPGLQTTEARPRPCGPAVPPAARLRSRRAGSRGVAISGLPAGGARPWAWAAFSAS